MDKLAGLLERYEGGKPYWPSTEERRIKVAEVYDKKGITYGNIVSLKTKKVKMISSRLLWKKLQTWN